MEKLTLSTELAMIKNSPQKELMALIKSKYKFSDEAASELISRGKHKVIMAYILNHRLSDANEVLLIKRGNHKEITSYFFTHGLCDQAEVALIERGKHNEIMDYIEEREILCSAAEGKLYERNNYDEVEYYESFQQVPPKVKITTNLKRISCS